MYVTRRGFLKVLGAAPLVLVAPSLSRIWVPEPLEVAKPDLELITPAVKASANGDLICGWVMPWEISGEIELEMVIPIMIEDAVRYFPQDAPIMALRSRKQRRSSRFMWRGSGIPMDGVELPVMASWPNYARMLWGN